EYYFRLTVDAPVQSPDATASAPSRDRSDTISFRTAERDPDPVVYYVAPDGDDANSGLSRQDAWRTVNRAADKVRPGDTVLVAGGTYHEAVRIRTTGDEGRPITFKAMPGEKVVFD